MWIYFFFFPLALHLLASLRIWGGGGAVGVTEGAVGPGGPLCPPPPLRTPLITGTVPIFLHFFFCNFWMNSEPVPQVCWKHLPVLAGALMFGGLRISVQNFLYENLREIGCLWHKIEHLLLKIITIISQKKSVSKISIIKTCQNSEEEKKNHWLVSGGNFWHFFRYLLRWRRRMWRKC